MHDEDLAVLPADGPALLQGAAQPEEHYLRWADLMRKAWGVDVLDCPCGGKRKFVEEVCSPEKIRQTLERLGLWREPPEVTMARRPPQARAFDRHSSSCDGVDPPAPDDAW
ncbi:MAG: hypothetical protein QM765_43065 [Myxococcales bacterium]